MAYIDNGRINSNDNVLFIKDKTFGMGKYHPVAWYRTVGNGKTFYMSMGHDAAVWQDPNFVHLVGNAIRWTIQLYPDVPRVVEQPEGIAQAIDNVMTMEK